MRLTRRYSGTLFFFPALLPLAALLPWLLTALGAVAALASFSLPRFLRRVRWVLVVLGAGAVLAGAYIYLDRRPPQFLLDHGTRPAQTPYAPVAADAPAAVAVPPAMAEFASVWHIKTQHQVLSTPVLSGDYLIYGTYNNSVEAVARDNGAPAWTLPVQNPVFALAAAPDGTVFAGEGLHETTAASLLAINAENGRVRWAREFLGHLEGEAAFDTARNRVFISAGPGGLWALDARDGAVLWHAPLGHIDSRPLLHGDVLYVPANTDEKNHKTFLFALDAATGAVLWRTAQPGQPWGSPLLRGDSKALLTTTGTGQIGVEKKTDQGWAQAVAMDGTPLWDVTLPGMALQPSVYIAERDAILHTTKNGYILLQSAKDGTLLWQEKVSTEFQAAAVYDNGLIAAVDFGGTFTVHDVATGTALQTRVVNNQSTASPVIDGDMVYVAGAYGITAFSGWRTLGAR